MIPFAVAFTGKSNTGKTELITKLIELFKDEGLKVGNVKKCSQGFEIDKEGKDSWRYRQAGSQAVLLLSPNQTAIIKDTRNYELQDAIDTHFSSFDIVLIEGFKEQKDLRKIAVIRKGVFEEHPPKNEGYIAIVSDFPIETNLPVFNHTDVKQIYEYLMGSFERFDSSSYLEVNGKKVPMKSFVKNFIMNINIGAIQSLTLKDTEIREIKIVIKPEKSIRLNKT